MDEYLRDKYENEDDDFFEPVVGEYHSSTLGHCLRRRYLDFKNPEAAEPGEGAWPHFELGNVLERVFEDALEAEFGHRYVKNSLPVEIDCGDYKIVGETDPVVMGQNGEIDQLWEVKTTTNLKYTRDSPKYEHVCQVHAYIYGLSLLNSGAKIVYIDKKNLDTVVHDVDFKEYRWDQIRDETDRLHEALTTDNIPEPVEEKKQDHFCAHGAKCCKEVE